jgi:hypothetical protein
VQNVGAFCGLPDAFDRLTQILNNATDPFGSPYDGTEHRGIVL